MEESLEDLTMTRRLRWLGHVARMNEERIPKTLLFAWLPQCRPAHGVKMRWRDRASKRFDVPESSWYRMAQETCVWRGKCREGLKAATEKSGRRQAEEEQRYPESWSPKLLPQPTSVLLVSEHSDDNKILTDTDV